MRFFGDWLQKKVHFLKPILSIDPNDTFKSAFLTVTKLNVIMLGVIRVINTFIAVRFFGDR